MKKSIPIITTLFLIFSLSFGNNFSIDGRADFLTQCIAHTNRESCECLLKNIEKNYSEKDFIQIQKKLKEGIENTEYEKFIVKKVNQCSLKSKTNKNKTRNLISALTAVQPTFHKKEEKNTKKIKKEIPKISATEMVMLKLMLASDEFKNSFVDECIEKGQNLLGKKQTLSSCQCAYNHTIQNDSLLFLLMINANAKGEVDDYDQWGYELIKPCLPSDFNQEFEEFLYHYCLNRTRGGNDLRCRCALSEIKKTYSAKEILKDAFLDENKFKNDLISMIGRCVLK